MARRDKVQAIWLDTRDLSISSVSRDGHPLKHYLDEPHEVILPMDLICQSMLQKLFYFYLETIFLAGYAITKA